MTTARARLVFLLIAITRPASDSVTYIIFFVCEISNGPFKRSAKTVIGEPDGRCPLSSAVAGDTSSEAQQAAAVVTAAIRRKVFIGPFRNEKHERTFST